MDFKKLVWNQLSSSKEYFDRSTRNLTEKDSLFSPISGMMSAAQQIAHSASTVEWFVSGAFSPTGFDLDFERHRKEFMEVTSIDSARSWLMEAYEFAISKFENSTEEELAAKIADGPILGGAPRYAAFLGIVEHSAHHRGALTGYTRLLGMVPPMPYMDM